MSAQCSSTSRPSRTWTYACARGAPSVLTEREPTSGDLVRFDGQTVVPLALRGRLTHHGPPRPTMPAGREGDIFVHALDQHAPGEPVARTDPVDLEHAL